MQAIVLLLLPLEEETAEQRTGAGGKGVGRMGTTGMAFSTLCTHVSQLTSLLPGRDECLVVYSSSSRAADWL